jgi:predicted O-methyltransferase YrrM
MCGFRVYSVLEFLFDNLPTQVKEFRLQYDTSTGGYRVPPRLHFYGIDSGKTAEWSNLPVQYDPVELPVADLLFNLAYNSHSKNILETGTSRGFSTCHLATAALARKGKVITIDLDPLPYHLWEATKLEPLIHSLKGRSSLVVKQDVEEILSGELFDILFLDSLHSYEHLISEIQVYESLLKVGGMIILHDTLFYDALGFVVDDLEVNGRFQVITIETHRHHEENTRSPGVTIARKNSGGPPVTAHHLDKTEGEHAVLPGSFRDAKSTPLSDILRIQRSSQSL